MVSFVHRTSSMMPFVHRHSPIVPFVHITSPMVPFVHRSSSDDSSFHLPSTLYIITLCNDFLLCNEAEDMDVSNPTNARNLVTVF